MRERLADRYRDDPAAFAREMLDGEDFKPTPYQEELLDLVIGVDVAGGPDETRFSVRRARPDRNRAEREACFWAAFRDWPLPVSSLRFPRFARYLKRHRSARGWFFSASPRRRLGAPSDLLAVESIIFDDPGGAR